MMDSSSQDEARYWGVLNRFRDFTKERPKYAGRYGGATCLVVSLAGTVGPTVFVLSLFLDARDFWLGAAPLGGVVGVLMIAAVIHGANLSSIVKAFSKRARKRAGWEAALMTFGKERPWLRWASPYRSREPSEGERASESPVQLTSSKHTNSDDPKHQDLLPVYQFLIEHWPDRAPRHLLGRVAELVPPWWVTLRAQVGGLAFLVHLVDGDALPAPLLVVLVAAPLDPSAASRQATETIPGRLLSEDGFQVGWTRAGPYAVCSVNGAASVERLTADLERALHRTVELARIGPRGVRVQRPIAPRVLKSKDRRAGDGIPVTDAILRMLRDRDHLTVLAHAYPPAFKAPLEPRVKDLGPMVDEAFRPTQWELVKSAGTDPTIAVGTYLATVPCGARYKYIVEVFNPNGAWYVSHFGIYEQDRQLYEFGESLDNSQIG